MLDFNTFANLLSVVESTQRAISKEIAIYDTLFDDFDGIPKHLAMLEDNLVDTISTAMGGSELVEWWVYECNLGDIPLIIERDGVETLIDSIEKLYEFILKENGSE